jgi:glutamine amidotransferase
VKVALFDTGIGNLHSLAKAIESAGHEVRVEQDTTRALAADALVLPGVGNFGAAAARLEPHREALRAALEDGLPCLGICLGMQLLFEASEEAPGDGIGALAGRVRRLQAPRVPHMGWNAVDPARADPLFEGTTPLIAYYAHSFVVEPADAVTVLAWTEYAGERFPAAVRRGRTWGVQFHPEKSAWPGLRLIRNFLAEAAA